MRAADIHIDNLTLDLRGLPPDVAREAAANLGPALREAIAAQLSANPRVARGGRIEQLNAPTIRVPISASAATVCTSIAQQVAHTLAGTRGGNTTP